MYKKSIYNIIVDTLENDGKLVFNTMTCVLGVMDLNTQALYENIESLDLEAIDDKAKESVNTMFSMGYILSKNYDEISIIKTRGRMQRFSSTDALSITVATSLNCNMACTYCYERRTAIAKSDMDSSMQNDIVNFVKNHLKIKSQDNLLLLGMVANLC